MSGIKQGPKNSPEKTKSEQQKNSEQLNKRLIVSKSLGKVPSVKPGKTLK